MSYDTACYDLAASFLDDSNANHRKDNIELAKELAQRIQTTIEDFMEEKGIQ